MAKGSGLVRRARADGDDLAAGLAHDAVGVAPLEGAIDAVLAAQRPQKDQHQRPFRPQRRKRSLGSFSARQCCVRRRIAYG